jgi:hypothetical protein
LPEAAKNPAHAKITFPEELIETQSLGFCPRIREQCLGIIVYAIVAETVALCDVDATSGHQEDPMSNVLLSVTVFHVLAAVAMFGFMVFSAVRLVQDRRSKG